MSGTVHTSVPKRRPVFRERPERRSDRPLTIKELQRFAPPDARCAAGGCLDCLAAEGKLPDRSSAEAADAYGRSQKAFGNTAADTAWHDHYDDKVRQPRSRSNPIVTVSHPSPGEVEREEKRASAEAAREARETMELKRGQDG